jgi:hypothetical protein
MYFECLIPDLELARCRAAEITLCIASPEAGHLKGRVGSHVLRLTMALCFQELKTAFALLPAHKHEYCTMWPLKIRVPVWWQNLPI